MRSITSATGVSGRLCRRLRIGVACALFVVSVEAVIGDVYPEHRNRGNEARIELFAVPRLVLATNRYQCTIQNDGDECRSSELGDGGVFPAGTPDGYIFNSGFQIAGIASEEAGPWAGDTSAAYMMDTKGGEKHGVALTPIYDSLNPDDLEAWPEEAVVDDPDLFDPILLRRKAISQRDTWTQYWDGDPARITGRQHPMGIRVTQRTMTWNYPAGNESVIYFLLAFENVTNDAEFQHLSELKLFGGDDALPDGGWAYHDVYVAAVADPDVGPFDQNFASAILPFDLGLAYHGGFGVAWFEYPPSVFYPPFFTAAPGIAAMKYLRSPRNPQTGEEVGLTMLGIYGWQPGGGFSFFDPEGAAQLWRYLSGRMDLSSGDPPCVIPAEIQTLSPSTTERSLCNIEQEAKDIRFFQASGPFALGPGEASTVVVAYIIAPTVQTMPDGTPSGIVAGADPNANRPGIPSFHPGYASARDCEPGGINCNEVLTADQNAVKPIERGAGWIEYVGPPPSGSLYPAAVEHPSNSIDEYLVKVVPGSLLGRALVAQTVFDNKFLLGFAPEPPAFHLIPGDDNVTVIWQPSVTETDGDPFYEVAGDPESALFNPNYRQFDVEGYRIWRGTQRGEMSLIAQFDYADTRFLDYTCETVPPDEDLGYTDAGGNPLLGFAAGDDCPGDHATNTPHAVRNIDGNLIFNNGSNGGAPGAGVSRAPEVFVTLDTAVVSDRDIGEVRPLTDSDVPFYHIDRTVTNNFTYFYSVTAFDVNSQASGPHSLRSARIAQSVVPRATNSALGTRFDASVVISGDDGVELDLTQSAVQPDADTGIFPGPQPPTNALDLLVVPPPADVAGLLTSGQLLGKIDSVTAQDISFGCGATGGNGLGACLLVHMTFDNGQEIVQTTSEIARPVWSSFGEPSSIEGAPMGAGNYPYDDARLADFGIPAGAGTGVAAGLSGTYDQTIDDPAFVGQRVRRFPGSGYEAGGNRWFDGTVEVTPDPNRFTRVGHIEGVDSVWSAQNHTPISATEGPYPASGQMQCFGYTMAILSRAADFQVTWGAGGTVTVRDITHNVPVDFKPTPQSSYGFLNTDGNGNGVIDWHDFDYLDVIQQATNNTNTFCEGAPGATSLLEATAQLQAVSLDGTRPSAGPMTNAGNGFGLYINGERYIFLTDQLPAEGTVWTYRTYNGRVWAQTNGLTDDPSDYQLRDGGGADRVASVPGLQLTLNVVEAGQFQEGPYDLTEVHTVPDPYLATSRYDLAPSTKQLMFVNLPQTATIRIYTLTGVLVNLVNHDDPSGGGRVVWDLRNRNNQFVASGVYFFHVVTPDGLDHVGKFTVIMAVQ